ncbi:MAG: erythromycin esterase family protein, partial [Algicola sp.]|nr:erythromycin esterase family protein [Algicola sp.]
MKPSTITRMTLLLALCASYFLQNAVAATDSASKQQVDDNYPVTVQWVKDNAIVLNGVEAGQGLDDMQPLKQLVGDARIVALGEATHGTREFFQLKHRMLEFLVKEKGFNIFAIEATMPEAFKLNQYVLTGKGDPAKALAGLYFRIWNTEEILTMIRWMRSYNANPAHHKKVKFYGFDMQSGTVAYRLVERYLAKVSSKMVAVLNRTAPINRLSDAYRAVTFHELTAPENQLAANTADSILSDLQVNKVRYVADTSERQCHIVHQHAVVLKQMITFAGLRNNYRQAFAHRDLSMANNIRWILEHEGREAKMVVWAHNGHVNTNQEIMGKTMGYHLDQFFSTAMVTFGFAFNQGGFQAKPAIANKFSILKPIDVKPLEQGSLDVMLADTGLAYAAIDLRNLPREGAVQRWFATKRASRNFGEVYVPGGASLMMLQPQQSYDALLFVENTTAARANPGARFGSLSIPQSLNNLDFEPTTAKDP